LARQGSLDLSRWDFEAYPTARLDGQWGFLWQPSLQSASLAGSPGSGTANLPGYWNGGRGSPYPAEGAATYRLHLLLPPEGGPWSLGVPETACAWRLTVNGLVVDENGKASVLREEYRAHVRSRIVALPPQENGYDLVLYVVNFTDRVGGIWDSVTVGPSSALERNQRLFQMVSAFFVGGLVVMTLFNLVIFFLQRRNQSNLWLAVFTALITIRTLFTGPRNIFDLWPDLSFEVSAQIEFLCIFGAVASFLLYLKFLFPQWWPARIFISFLLYTALFAVLLFLLPIKTYATAVQSFYYGPLVCLVFVVLGIGGWAVKKKHEDGPMVFCGMLFLVTGVLNDLVYQFIPLPQGYVLDRFLFIFLLFNTILLSRQISKDFELTRRQAGELLELDKMKDDFLARVTHELRTPLHGMVGILDGFRMGDFGPLSNRQTYHLGLLEASSKRLLSMVSSILDFGRLRKHQLTVLSRPIFLNQTVDFLLPSFHPQLKPGVALVNRISEQFPAALGDEVKLEQILHNLIQNALQHTESGTITLEAELRDQQILLTVRDTGQGIAPHKLAQLFSPFHQVSEIDTRATGGLGLGLAISNELIQLMGGRLELQSKEGVGTTAVLWLPLCPPTKSQYF
jgi:two-component system sensor histidine kinase ChiS